MESFKVKSTCSAVNFCPHFQRRYHYCHNLSLDPTNQGQVLLLSVAPFTEGISRWCNFVLSAFATRLGAQGFYLFSYSLVYFQPPEEIMTHGRTFK